MNDTPSPLADLEARVRRLEALYGVIDLLALPGMLAGGAASMFDARQSAESLPDRAIGFFPKESAGRGLTIRWTRYPDAGELAAPILQGFPFRLELAVLPMPHVSRADDIVLALDGEEIALGAARQLGATLVFAAEFMPARSGLARVALASRAPLQAAGGDTRQLGLPFVSLRTWPDIASAAAVSDLGPPALG